jgi:hypothetical protein
VFDYLDWNQELFQLFKTIQISEQFPTGIIPVTQSRATEQALKGMGVHNNFAKKLKLVGITHEYTWN